MDDHMYDEMESYAECDLIPRFRDEYKEYGKVSLCPSYQEMKDLCIALNAVAPYAGPQYTRKTPIYYIRGY